MTFKYKKKRYENIYSWNESGEGTCFYCKIDKPIEIELIGNKGICEECLNDFEIGNVGADRHVIQHIIPEFDTYKDVVKWFEDKGIKMIFKTKIDDTYIYDAINNESKYKEYQELLVSDGIIPMNEEFMYSSNSVEISKDGKSIHIIY